MDSSGGELGQKGIRGTSHQGTERKWGWALDKRKAVFSVIGGKGE